MLTKVISGGQIGADVAALRAAQKCGLETGGFVPKGWRTLDGPAPELSEFGCVETNSSDYPSRTKLNVQQSDATMRIAVDFNSKGEKLTLREIQRANRPCYDVPIDVSSDGYSIARHHLREVVEWVRVNNVHVLNVAGNGRTEIEPIVQTFLTLVFRALRDQV